MPDPPKKAAITSNDDIAPCLSVIIPFHNEARTLPTVLATVLAQRPVAEIIAVDDASSDASWDILQECARQHEVVHTIQHQRNQGKGAALRTGIARCSAPFVVVQDADLEYDPAEFFRLLSPLLNNQADVVYGSRFLESDRQDGSAFWHRAGNRALTHLSNLTTGLRLTDMETCYKVFRRDLIQRISIQEERFGFEPEITAKISRLQARVREVPISYRGRSRAEGKKIGWKDGVSALRCILQYRFAPLDGHAGSPPAP